MDETMSEEVAFNGEQQMKEDVFKFDPVKEEEATPPAPQAENEEKESDSVIKEDKESDVGDEPARVPYSRFKSVKNELDETRSTISMLEERLASLETARTETQPNEDIDVPPEWVKLYGDSDVSKQAYKIQLERELQIEERATRRALERFKEEAQKETQTLKQNEEIIEQNLESLQETIGRKLTPKIEEEILSIVDEFSPTGPDGKYVSLFPFDKAYEIYELRNSKVTQKTMKARTQVADLTGNTSEGETDSSETSFKRGWDNWREAL